MKINKDDLTNATKKELVHLAKKVSIKRYSKMNREELIASLSCFISDAQDQDSTVSSELSFSEARSSKHFYGQSQDEVSISKFIVAEDSTSEPLPQEYDGIPGEYGVNRIVLLVRDPFWLHAYWEITPEQVSHVCSLIDPGQRGSTRLVLRVLDVTGTDSHYPRACSYIDVMLEARNWYINVQHADRAYCVEIGYLCADGKFYALAQSNTVRTPRDGMSNIFDEQWMSLEDYDRLYVLSGGLGIGLSSMELAGKKGQVMSRASLSSGASHLGIPEQTKKDFFLSTDTELVLYGKTAPGSVIQIGGIEKKAGPDGSFSVRFQLNKGEHVIPLKAWSPDGKNMQDISIKINRENT